MHKLWTKNFTAIIAANTLMATAFNALIITLPPYLSGTLKMSQSSIGIIMSVFAISALIARPFAGHLNDNYSRFPIFLTALGLMTCLYALYPLASTFAALIGTLFLRESCTLQVLELLIRRQAFLHPGQAAGDDFSGRPPQEFAVFKNFFRQRRHAVIKFNKCSARSRRGQHLVAVPAQGHEICNIIREKGFQGAERCEVYDNSGRRAVKLAVACNVGKVIRGNVIRSVKGLFRLVAEGAVFSQGEFAVKRAGDKQCRERIAAGVGVIGKNARRRNIQRQIPAGGVGVGNCNRSGIAHNQRDGHSGCVVAPGKRLVRETVGFVEIFIRGIGKRAGRFLKKAFRGTGRLPAWRSADRRQRRCRF